MDNLWTWGGRYFGYREGNDLWTYDGKHAGRFQGEVVYGPDGRYLGELINGRLITNLGKKPWITGSFAQWGRRAPIGRLGDYVGYGMYAGHEDFPKLEG